MDTLQTIDIQDAPKNISNEQEILATILLNDKKIRDISDSVSGKMFYDEYNAKIYTAMLYLFHSNIKIGYETLIDRIKYKEPNDNNIVDYILQIANAYQGNDDIETKAELLKDNYRKRVLYDLYIKRLTNPMGGISSSNLVKEIEDKIDGMGITSNIEYEKFETYIDEWLKYQEDETPIQSHKLGFKLLDDLVLLENSNLMLIGARPSVGKSAFATNLVKNFCLQGKHPLFVSLEMNKKEFMNRLVSNMAHIPARKLKRKEHKTSQDWSSIMSVKEQISSFKFNFYDKGGMKVEQLLGLCRHLKKHGELDVLIIDYLQLLESNQYRGQKQNQVAYISQKLKQLAMELDIPVIALSQLSRGVVSEGGQVREPVLSDLRDSGSLEQDANVVIMLHTDDVDQKHGNNGSKYGRIIKLFVRKNRDGKLGKINYEYFGDYVEFVEKEFDPLAGKWVAVNQEPTIEISEDDLPF